MHSAYYGVSVCQCVRVSVRSFVTLVNYVKTNEHTCMYIFNLHHPVRRDIYYGNINVIIIATNYNGRSQRPISSCNTLVSRAVGMTHDYLRLLSCTSSVLLDKSLQNFCLHRFLLLSIVRWKGVTFSYIIYWLLLVTLCQTFVRMCRSTLDVSVSVACIVSYSCSLTISGVKISRRVECLTLSTLSSELTSFCG